MQRKSKDGTQIKTTTEEHEENVAEFEGIEANNGQCGVKMREH